MPFDLPTLAEWRERTRTAVEARLPGADARLRHSPLRVMSEVVAGAASTISDYLSWYSRQPFVDTAESAVLARHSDIWDQLRRSASPATGVVALSGTAGAVVPAGTDLRRSDGALYKIQADVMLDAGGAATATVVAEIAGAEGNADEGMQLAFLGPVDGVAGTAIVGEGGLAEGANEEEDEPLRARVLDRIHKPPHGGNLDDYVKWALEVPGVTRAWASYGDVGPGSIVLRFMMDDTYPDGIPQGGAAPNYSGDVAAVFDHVNGLRPVKGKFYAAAPIPRPLAVTVRGLTPDTPSVREAAAAEIADAIVSESEPGLDFPRSKLWEAVSRATGEQSHEIVAPAGHVVQLSGRIFVPGPVSFVAG